MNIGKPKRIWMPERKDHREDRERELKPFKRERERELVPVPVRRKERV